MTWEAIFLVTKGLFFYPGNKVILHLMDAELSFAQSLVAMFGIDGLWYFGWTSGVLSAICWAAAIALLANIIERILHRRATA